MPHGGAWLQVTSRRGRAAAALPGASRRCPPCPSRRVLCWRLWLHTCCRPAPLVTRRQQLHCNTQPQLGRAAGAGGAARAVDARRAGSCEQWDRASEGTAAAGCRLRFELERRTGWPAGRAGPGEGSKEVLRGGGCRRRMPDRGHGAPISRRDRSRASPSARSSTSRTTLDVRSQRFVDDLDGLRRPVEIAWPFAPPDRATHSGAARRSSSGGRRTKGSTASAHAPRQRLSTPESATTAADDCTTARLHDCTKIEA